MQPKLQRWVQRQGWNRASSCYEQYWQRQLQPAIDLVLEHRRPPTGEDVIDVACGTGLVALPAAASVAPNGRVFATDISPKMIDEVERRAIACGLANVGHRCQQDRTATRRGGRGKAVQEPTAEHRDRQGDNERERNEVDHCDSFSNAASSAASAGSSDWAKPARADRRSDAESRIERMRCAAWSASLRAAAYT